MTLIWPLSSFAFVQLINRLWSASRQNPLRTCCIGFFSSPPMLPREVERVNTFLLKSLSSHYNFWALTLFAPSGRKVWILLRKSYQPNTIGQLFCSICFFSSPPAYHYLFLELLILWLRMKRRDLRRRRCYSQSTLTPNIALSHIRAKKNCRCCGVFRRL